jgi:hypothetical protein
MTTTGQLYKLIEKIVTRTIIDSEEPIEPPLYAGVLFDPVLFSALGEHASTPIGLTEVAATARLVMEGLVAGWDVTAQSMRWCCITAMLVQRLSRKRRVYRSVGGVVAAPLDDKGMEDVAIPLDLPTEARERVADVLAELSAAFSSNRLDEVEFDRRYRSALFSGPLSLTGC